MSPRRSIVDARKTRSEILRHGVEVASVEGLDGLTIGRLAADLGLSKSGLLGHFGSKERLQLAVLDAAAGVFAREVVSRLAGTAVGMPRLLAMCEAWVSYAERGVFPGGCFFTAAGLEFDDRDGPMRDAVVDLHRRWQGGLRRHARLAVAAGDLVAETDPDQVAFELISLMLGLNHALQVHRDRTAPDHARRAMSRLLGHDVSPGTLAKSSARPVGRH